ncbi:hypothetical protein COS75_02065 [Candidatus Pacearchaeota archaeon CG06_land_8_20_14_3_00_35_12]|nr:MAG: hypothetical protein COS75_02065 [Candidatus Pacearchaeota archaeon CG06_land_8_20_14_3_00_35_12]
MKILVDSREKNSLVLAELSELGAETEIKQLVVADYIIGEIAIERKAISDFISSMINKRLVRQLEEMKQFKKSILIIEGYDNKNIYSTGVHENAIRGMILAILLDFETPIIFTKNEEDTAKYLTVLAKRLERGPKEISLRAKKRIFSAKEQQQIILEGFPGIGPSLAKAMLKKFGSIQKIINASLEELKEIKKLDEKKAKIIKELIERRYY